MFTPQALKKVNQLFNFFSKKDKRWKVHLRSWDDFKRVPVTSREQMKDFLKTGFADTVFNLTATSGSTSSRLLIAHSRQAYEAHLSRLVKIYRLFGVKEGALCLNLCSYDLNSGGRLMESAFKAAGAGVIPLGPVSTAEKLQEAVFLIKTFKPTLVNAYTNQLFDLFALLGKKHSIQRCLVNGEPLWPDYRQRIECLGGVRVHDHYGAMEISGLACALAPHDEYMKVVADGLLLEVLDNELASESGQGDLLVTDLNNTCMPFIRYRLGDRVQLKRDKEGLWIKVQGRIQESLLINGVVVLKQELIRTVNDVLKHPSFFFVIDKDPQRYYDKLFINIVKLQAKDLRVLKDVVVQKIGLDRCIEIRKHEGAIPRTLNGKIRYFIDARKQ
ncbi:MAG: phenylacetate--CoA ligase family protein [Candidatus Omnitrophica bacterium]|nr:phenylacetate--CoA ligase family protein [Candidatus Omnitrophota bacterium]